MASDKEIEIKVKTTIETAESARSLGDIKKSIKELKSLALEVGEGGKGFTNLTKQANELQDKLDDLKDSTKSLQGTGIEKLKSSFGLLTDSFNNADFGKAKIAFQGLGSAMKAVPIFLIIEGVMKLLETFDVFGKVIGFITDLFYSLTDALGLTHKAAEKQAKAVIESQEKQKIAVENRYDAEIKMAQAAGRETEYLEIEKLSIIEDSVERQLQELTNLKNEKGKLNEEEQKQYEELQAELLKVSSDRRAKELEEERKFREKLTAYNDFQTTIETENAIAKMSDRQKEIFLIRQKSQEQLKELDKKEVFNYQTTGKQIENQLKVNAETRRLIQETAAIEIGKINKKYNDKAKEDNLKYWQDLNKDTLEVYRKGQDFMAKERELVNKEREFENDQLEERLAQKAISTAKTTAEEISRVQRAIFYQNVTEISGQINQFTQAIGQTLNSIVGVFQAIGELNQQRREQELKAEQEKTDSLIAGLDTQKEYELSKEGLTNEQKDAINKKYAQQEYQLRLLQYNRETEVKKKAFEQDKKLKIAQTIISTVTGAVSAFVGMVQSIPGPVGLVLGALSAAAVTAMGVIQITKIREQKFDAGSPPSPPSTNVGGSTNIGNQSSTSPMEAPNLRRIGRNVGEEYENENGNGNSKIQVVRAYVTSEDIENSQNKNSVIKRRSSF